MMDHGELRLNSCCDRGQNSIVRIMAAPPCVCECFPVYAGSLSDEVIRSAISALTPDINKIYTSPLVFQFFSIDGNQLWIDEVSGFSRYTPVKHENFPLKRTQLKVCLLCGSLIHPGFCSWLARLLNPYFLVRNLPRSSFFLREGHSGDLCDKMLNPVQNFLNLDAFSL